jgi:hypothetical protein
MKYVMLPMFKLVPGMSHSVEDGAGRYLRVAQFGDEVSGEFYASPNKKMTGELARMDLPHIADRRAQRAGWDATVKVSGVDMPALSGARQTVVADVALSKAA